LLGEEQKSYMVYPKSNQASHSHTQVYTCQKIKNNNTQALIRLKNLLRFDFVHAIRGYLKIGPYNC